MEMGTWVKRRDWFNRSSPLRERGGSFGRVAEGGDVELYCWCMVNESESSSLMKEGIR